MSPALFILTITCYLVSMAAALVVSFFSKLIPSRLINTIIIFHFLTLITWFILPAAENSILNPVTANYFFLIFFCSGIICAGLILRKDYVIYIKIYFTFFIASIIVFIISPSRVIGFVSSGSFESINPRRIHISENYFFVEQSGHKYSGDSARFKIVREMGMFHKTLAREIVLSDKTDSVKMLEFTENENIFIRAYASNENKIDSLDINITLNSNRDSSGIITRKPQPK